MLGNDVDIKKIVVCHKYFNLKTAWGFPKSFSATKLSFKPDGNSNTDPNKRDELPALMWLHLSQMTPSQGKQIFLIAANTQ